MKKAVKPEDAVVTRVAYSWKLNAGKFGQLTEQARCLGQVRSRTWHEFGSVAGVSASHIDIRHWWMADGSAGTFGVLATPWKETVRDARGDIEANCESAKIRVVRAIWQRTSDEAERERLFRALKTGTWIFDPYLRRMMRKHWKHGRNRTFNQIVVRSDNYTTQVKGSITWLAIPSLVRNKTIKIPLKTSVPPSGTLRLILRDGTVEVHYQVKAASLKSSQRPCGTQTIGVDKGYTEVLVDSDGVHHGPGLGKLLAAASDQRKVKHQRRQKIKAVADAAAKRGDHAKAARILQHNLGTKKRSRADRKVKAEIRTLTFKAVHEVVDKASLIAAEDLTKHIPGRKEIGPNMNRRLAAWTKGVTAEALESASSRRGSSVQLVNACYTSQVDPETGFIVKRNGNSLYCANGVVWQADHAAAVNILQRLSDPDITLPASYIQVGQILREREAAAGGTASPRTLPKATPGRRERIPPMDKVEQR